MATTAAVLLKLSLNKYASLGDLDSYYGLPADHTHQTHPLTVAREISARTFHFGITTSRGIR